MTGITNAQSTTTSYLYDTMCLQTGTSAAGSYVTITFVDDLLTGITHNNAETENTNYTLSYTTANLPLEVKVGNRTLMTRYYYTGRWTTTTMLPARRPKYGSEKRTLSSVLFCCFRLKNSQTDCKIISKIHQRRTL